ncbi:MAG TPA: PKD domain-containing protein, partial [Chitinophagaceae bacterium]|nr:PKD domain-containing protein [Chitinophagaceae bacterium]
MTVPQGTNCNGNNTPAPPGGCQDMVLYFAAEQAANVTVSIPGIGYTQNYAVPANSVITSQPIPKNPSTGDARLTATSTAPENKGIHITSDKPIVAYAHIYNASVSGASILFPTPTLGKEYYSINYQNTSNSNNANCWFYVVAADTGTTTVQIIPSAATTNGWAAGSTNTITLTQGQVFNVMGQLTTTSNPFQGVDLTGSIIKSVATASGACKRIAVFSGSGRISITCNANSSSSDNYMVQAFPKSAWGKKFLTVTTGGNQSNNIYRVCVSDPTTVVTLNGAPIGLPLQGGFYYQIASSNTPKLIEADKPITVAQYLTSQGACGNGNTPGDPEVIYLSPVEQNISKVLWNATPNFQITQHYFNVIIPNTGTAISSFTLDGAPVPAASFTVHPQATGYSYLRQSVSAGQHIIQSDSGFNAIAYGYGNAESYGYNAGTNIKDIFQFISLQNQYATVNFPATCKNTPFYFSMTFPYQPTQIQWIFGAALNAMGIADVTINNPVYTSTIVVAGRTLYVYQLPTPYNITASGTYPIRVTATNPTPDGCGGVQEINYDVQVFDPPQADFTFNNVCFPDPVQFTDNSNTGGRPITSRYWDFGDLTNSTLNNPSHAYSAPGAYTARYAIITDVGCLSDTTSHVVTVSPLPTATISGTTTVCLNGTSPNITFTGVGGTAPYTFTYNINGGANQTVTTTSGNSVTVAAPTGTAGTFAYNLVSVSDASPALCSQAQTGTATITVSQLPTASIAGATTVCLNAPSPNITFTGAVGTPPYTFTYNINGGANQTVTTTSGNSVTVAVPTSTAGIFTYNLVSVAEGSANACSQPQTGSTVVNVSPLPTASISGTTTVCLNGPSPSITFTGAVGTPPFTFTYTINGGPNQTVTTTSGNSVTVSVPTTTAGTFTYNLVGVSESSANACSQPQTGSAAVTVNPLPTASISGTTTVCLNATSPNITFTGAVGTPPFTFTYNINGGPSQTVTTTSGNSVTVAAPTNVAGTFTYNLVSVQEGSTITCSQAQTGSATITVNQLPTATIAGTVNVCVNAPSPNITFTGAVGTPPYTFTYNING